MSRRKDKSPNWLIVPSILILLAIFGVVSGMLGKFDLALSMGTIWEKLVIPITRLVCYLTIGLSIGILVESMGWSEKLAGLVKPVTNFARMKNEAAAAFVSAFISGIVANTMLMGYMQEERLTKRELILAYIMNNGLPIYLVHLPSTFFIVVSIAGEAGLTYLGITFIAACLRTFFAALYSRISSDALTMEPKAQSLETASKVARKKAPIIRKLLDRLTRIILYTIPIYVIVFLVNQWGLFKILRNMVAGSIASDFYPVQEASMVIFTLAAEFSSGFAAAAALMDGGALTVKQASIALVLGTIAAAPVRAIRHQLPTHTGIFSIGLGTELLILSQSLRIISLIIALLPYGFLF